MSMIFFSAAQRDLARRLLERALAFNSQTAPTDALSLKIAGRRVGLLLPHAVEQIRNCSLANLFRFGQSVVEFVPENSVDEALSLVARTFHDAGFFFQWRNELLDVVDASDDTPFAVAERGLFRYFGLATRCVYAVGFTQDGRLFLCQRSFAKQVDPGLWDVLAAGLVSQGETPEQALVREIHEEAGLTSADFQPLGRWHRFEVRRLVEEGWMHEDAFCMPVYVKNEKAVHNLDGEVCSVQCVPVDTALERIEANLVPWDTSVALLSVLLES